MINVLFFARLKDQVGKSELKLADDLAGKTVAEIRENLIEQGVDALKDSSIRIALNQDFCAEDAIVQSGDEIAFMPPVTGG